MKITYKLITLVIFSLLFLGCQNDDEDDIGTPKNLEIQNFIWKGMNLYYLWQADVPNLSDNKFANQSDFIGFLSKYPQPENLFDALRVDKNTDRFSWIVDDYLELEAQFQGTTNNNGLEFELNTIKSGSSELIGWVTYVIPNSNASTKNIKRGDIFYAVNGTKLTTENYMSLLFGSNDDYTLSMATLINGVITPNNITVPLTKTVLNENPILINKVINSGSHKIGYLMYNGFYSNYDIELNNAFGTLKSQGITDLVLDLRYNRGGSVLTATRLASMITGAYTGQIFSKQQWNTKIESYFAANDPESLNDLFVDKIDKTAINSLNLKKVYILTSQNSASASELIINGLKPYINVIQIGDVTSGKNVGSVTVYDSPNFGKEKRNPNHRYAMQPIVFKIVNKEGFGDYQNGLVPNFKLIESISNLNELGNTAEPLLNLAISKITGISSKQTFESKKIYFNKVADSKSAQGMNQMYIEKAPEGLLRALE